MTRASGSEMQALNRSVTRVNTISLLRKPGELPRLLVSVRSLDEANTAIEGGANVLDMKEPARGSLGMADLHEIHSVARHSAVVSHAIPFSVALGELSDWQDGSEPAAMPEGIAYAKLGLRGCAQNLRWRSQWRTFRERVESRLRTPLSWVAVCYADGDAAESPTVNEVIDAAREAGCAGLLIDTCTKTGGTLLDYLDATSLTDIAHQCHAGKMFLAVAGRLNQAALATIAQVPCDVVAIRSAACRGAHRTAAIDVRCIVEFQQQLQRCF